MIHITIDNNGDIEHVHAVAYLLLAFTKGAPGYDSMAILEGPFDDEMREWMKIDLREYVEGGVEDEEK